jgi:tryptophanyl-tRNA synthetase
LDSGIDPGKSTIYLQSWVPETAELHLLLSMLTPNNWPERDPTLKDLVRSTDGTLTYGMLGYPVLQTADILTFRGAVVPVGKDQEAHLEMSRQIARRFNHLYGRELFPEPQAVLTETPSVKGIDSQKMSKSLDNDIKLAATPEETQARVKRMITDRERVRRQDPGSTERCEVPFPYYGLFADEQAVATTKHECETAQRGCMDCKKILSGIINEHLAEFRDRRASIDEDTVWDVLREGSARARPVAAETLEQARSAMGVCRARK